MSLFSSIEQAIQRKLNVFWRTRLNEVSVINRAFISGLFRVAVFVFVAKLVVLTKEAAVAWRYGTSTILEGYLLIFNFVSLQASVAFSVMSSVLIPWLISQQSSDSATVKLRHRQVTVWVWLLAIGITIIFYFGLSLLIASGLLGLSAEGRETVSFIIPYMVVIVGLGIVASWHACQLMSVQNHSNSFIEAMPAIGVLIAVLMLPRPELEPLLWGTLLGYTAQALLMAWVARSAGFPIIPVWPPGRPFVYLQVKNASWIVAAQLVMSMSILIDQAVFTYLPPGSLATYNYANRIMAVVLTLSSTVIGRVILPLLSGLTDVRHSSKIALRWSFWVFFSGVMVVVLLEPLTQTIVKALFEHGAFTVRDTEATSELLSLMILQTPLYMVHIILWYWLSSRQYTGILLFMTAITATFAKLTVLWMAVIVAEWGTHSIVVGEITRVAVISIILFILATRAATGAS